MTPRARGRGTARSNVDWKRFLASGTPQEVLARLVSGDPLRVREQVAVRLRETCRLLDGERVALRAMARVARFAPRYRGRPSFEDWLKERCDEAIADLMDEEREFLFHPRRAPRQSDSALHVLAEPLGIDPKDARRACVALNSRSFEERDAFFALVLEAGSLDQIARERGTDPTTIAKRARRALLAIIRPEERDKEELL